MIEDAVAHVVDAEVAFGGRRRPDGGEARAFDVRRFAREIVPPVAVLVHIVNRHVPVERLQHRVVLRVRAHDTEQQTDEETERNYTAQFSLGHLTIKLPLAESEAGNAYAANLASKVEHDNTVDSSRY